MIVVCQCPDTLICERVNTIRGALLRRAYCTGSANGARVGAFESELACMRVIVADFQKP